MYLPWFGAFFCFNEEVSKLPSLSRAHESRKNYDCLNILYKLDPSIGSNIQEEEVQPFSTLTIINHMEISTFGHNFVSRVNLFWPDGNGGGKKLFSTAMRKITK